MKIDPWASKNIEKYEKLFKEFGIARFDPYVSKLENPSRLMTSRAIFGHRDFGRIYEAITKKKPYAMLTGFMPSGKFHFGHKTVLDQILWYQENGADVFIAVADLEASTVRKMPLEELRKTAIDQYLTNYIALGLKPKNVHFYFQSDYTVPYYKLSAQLSQKVTFNEMRAIYGELSPAKIVSALLQAADILQPQLEENGGPKPVVVPVGADQDPHIRLARDLAARFSKEYGFISPSSTYHKFMPGLGGGKMSSSVPESYIALTDEIPDAIKKLKNALTGGRDTLAEQKEKGGMPDKCVVYEFLMLHLMDEKECKRRKQDCKAGKILCGECKQNASELMSSFLEKHQENREKAEKTVEKIAGR